MVTLEEARETASEYLRDICGCTEYSTAYVFLTRPKLTAARTPRLS